MMHQYKKTLPAMQGFIVAVTLTVFAWSHLVALAAVFFVTMQVSAVIGAAYATRLDGKLKKATGAVPRGA